MLIHEGNVCTQVFARTVVLNAMYLVIGFDVAKTGDARIGFVGFPSVGKSTLLSNLAGVYSEVAAYEFTTLTTVPGKVRLMLLLVLFLLLLMFFIISSCFSGNSL